MTNYKVFENKKPKGHQLNSQNLKVSMYVMMFNATFINISTISLLSVLMVEQTGVPGENHRPVASY